MLENKIEQIPRIFFKNKKGYGFHHPRGIFFAHGGDVRKFFLKSPRITDILPTILHILDIPLPDDLSGRVLTEIFQPGSYCREKQTYYQGPSVVKNEIKLYSKSQDERIKRRLEEMGYLE